ncbi:LOW QUALITY PROTEIN: kinesin-like protein KIF18B [Macaca thibetana thibetana]|uniref:LOW QUALITY PROTEIN: kinesin-like protein KIF18B n=1 Tax=Macaca thibetana thibetana TaxID=257877 RepID=UPI0021BCCEE9|nr:LOW QUALITY PROTEIN: kinesin-like protein KIF18B [Macaca thibetana thibetana]
MAVEDSTLQVVVRVRPPTPRELDGQRRPVVQVVDERVLVFNPEEPDGGLPSLKWGGTHDGPKKKGKDLTFVFDRIFGEAATQQDVFQHTTHSILDSFLQGYNCSVFAYGATGAGKTHTMLGREGDPGIMYLTTVELYRRLEARQQEKCFEVLISYQEVYNEQIHDLLEPKGPLAIREDPDKGVVVQGLSFHQPASAEQLLEMLTRGNRNRTQHPTDANATSSRSHAIFQIFVKQQDRVPGLTQAVQMAKMSLIDLAGSERASSTHAKGERLREGANINRSLLALINVLNALADAKGRKTHVPYRDSKLTRLLKDSLGGNCRTVMIAAISPSSLAYEDTYNTLKYADRAKEIRLSLKSNVTSLDCHISQYATICQQLQAEVAALRKKLQVYEGGGQPPKQYLPRSPKSGPPPQHLPSSPLPPHPPSQPCTPELPAGPRALQEESLGTEAQVERAMEGNSSDQEQSPKDQGEGPAEEVPTQMPEQNPTHALPESPGLTLQPNPVVGHLSAQELERDRSKQLALKVLCLAQRQYSLLQAANLLTPDMITEFETLQQLVQEEKTEPGAEASSTSGLARGAPLTQELCSESIPVQSPLHPEPPGYTGPVTRTMARRLSGPLHMLGIPSGPNYTPAQESRWPMEKKKRRRPSPLEPDSPMAPKRGTKRQRQSFLPCLRRGSLPDAQPLQGPSTPKGERASSPCHSPHFCPTTVIKSRVPLGPSAMQNCSTPLALPTRDLNATFDLSEEPPSKPSFHECIGWDKIPQELSRLDQPFIPRGSMPLFTMKGPKPTSSLPGTSACQKKRIASSSVSRGRSRIARLPSSTLKRPAGPLYSQVTGTRDRDSLGHGGQ